MTFKDKPLAYWKGKKLSDNHKQNISKAHRGKYPSNINQIAGWNKGLPREMQPCYGHKQSDYVKQRVSETMKGKPKSDEHIMKMVKYRSGFGKGKNRLIKSGNRIIPLSNFIWCSKNRIHRIPFSNYKKLCLIHHLDGNRENNNIDNLQILPNDFHAKLHAQYNKTRNEVSEIT